MKLQLFSILLLFLFIACNKDQTSLDYEECVEAFLEKSDMRPYVDGEELGCQFFVHLHEFRGDYYFILDNYCADLVLTVQDCEAKTLCDLNFSSAICSDVLSEEANYIGIVGVRE